MTEENKHEANIPRFNGGKEDDYHLWSVCVKTALRCRELKQALRTGNKNEIKNERALSIITAVLGGNSLRAVHDYENAKDM